MCQSRIQLFCKTCWKRMAGNGDGLGTTRMCLLQGESLEKLKKIDHQSQDLKLQSNFCQWNQ